MENAVATSEVSDAHWMRQLEQRQEMLVAKHVPRGIAEMLCSDGFNAKHHYAAAVAQWLGGRKRFLILSGPSYRGKSVAAASMENSLCRGRGKRRMRESEVQVGNSARNNRRWIVTL